MRQWLQSAESTANDGPMNSGPIEPFNFSDLPNLIDLLPLEEVDKDPGLPKHTLGTAGRLLNRKDARHSRQASRRQARRRRRRSSKRRAGA